MKKLVFLIIADKKSIYKDIKKTLKSAEISFDIFFENDYDKIIQILMKHNINVLIADLMLKNIDSFSLMKEIKYEYPSIVRIFFTDLNDKDFILQGMDVAHQVIKKDFRPNFFLKIVNSAVRNLSLLEKDGMQRIVSKLDSIPIIPEVYMKLLNKFQIPNVPIKAIGDLIAKDISLTTKVLQIANSAMLAHKGEITTPNQAAIFLGLNTLRALILYVEVFFNNSYKQVDDFSVKKLEYHSREVAKNALKIIEYEDREDLADSAYVSGLLHDFGQLVILNSFKDDYAPILDKSKDENIPLWKVEREKFDVDHAEVAAYLLGIWGLPDDIVEAVLYHHEPSKFINKDFCALSAIHFANSFVNHKDADSYEYLSDLDVDYYRTIGRYTHLSDWFDMLKNKNKDE
jgi:HD-like signal output (HDOD) protein